MANWVRNGQYYVTTTLSTLTADSLVSVTSVVKLHWVNREYIFGQKLGVEKCFFDLTFTDFQTGRQKVPKSDVHSKFSISKIIRFFFHLQY